MGVRCRPVDTVQPFKEEIAALFEDIKNLGRNSWKIVLLFYAVIHYCNILFVKQRLSLPRSHEDRFRQLSKLASKNQITEDFLDLYSSLRQVSEYVRYCPQQKYDDTVYEAYFKGFWTMFSGYFNSEVQLPSLETTSYSD